MPDVHSDATEDEIPTSWVIRGAYAVLIGVNLYMAYQWWADSEGGRQTIGRWKAAAANCEGCRRRKAWLAAQTARMHRQAREIVEEAGADSEPPT